MTEKSQLMHYNICKIATNSIKKKLGKGVMENDTM